MITVQFGNKAAQELTDGATKPVGLKNASVTTALIPQGVTQDGLDLYSVGADADLPETVQQSLDGIDPLNLAARRMIVDGWLSHPSGVKGLPNQEAIASLIAPNGIWRTHSYQDPTWVQSDDSDLEALLSLYFNCPVGAPADVEDTHWTTHGTTTYPPGAKPDPLSGIKAMHTSFGRDSQAAGMGGFGYLGTDGTATAVSATSVTGGTETGASHAADDCAGRYIVITTTADKGKYAFIRSHTSGTTPVYTIDRWYSPASPGGAAPATPAATSTYAITQGSAPSPYVALSTDTTTPALAGAAGTADIPSATQVLTGEIVTSGGGLVRKIGVLAHTAGAATWTNTPVFTGNGTDSYAVTVAKAGLCASLGPGGGTGGSGVTYMTLVTPTAVLSASGDQLTLTWTFTMT